MSINIQTKEEAKATFTALHIEKAHKRDSAVIEVKFDESEKIYTYVRTIYDTQDEKIKFVLIDGKKVFFDDSFNILGYEFVSETSPKKRFGGGKNKQKFPKTKREKKELAEQAEVEKKEESKPEEVKETETQLEKSEIKAEQPNDGKHEQYDTIKTCLTCGIPVYLAGPAGAGKNYTVEQIARELGWGFYFSNSVQQEYKLTGFIDAGGKFHETEFYKACTCEQDCIFFLDEMDASIPEVLVLLNAAIANGYFEFPNGRVDFDKVHFVAAGNTVGSGADEMYTGRMVLDQATLDRFAIINFDYSEKVEKLITNNNLELIEFIHGLREQAESNGVRATFSYRCMTMVTKLENAGMSLENALRISVFKGMDKDTLNTFSGSGSKYWDAMKKAQRG